MINLQVYCDKCGKDSGSLTLVKIDRSIRDHCFEAGYIAESGGTFFKSGDDFCFDCAKQAMPHIGAIVEGE